MDKNDLNKSSLNSQDLSEIEARLEEIKTRTSEFVKEHPLISISIAAGVGYLIAKIFSGRK